MKGSFCYRALSSYILPINHLADLIKLYRKEDAKSQEVPGNQRQDKSPFLSSPKKVANAPKYLRALTLQLHFDLSMKCPAFIASYPASRGLGRQLKVSCCMI